MLNKIEKARDEAFRKKDDEFEQHKVDLEKRYLKEADWIVEPLENPKNNFFEPLIKEYVKDIDIRNTFEVNQKEGFTRVIRKNCPLDSVEKLVLDMYEQTIGIRQQIREREQEILRLQEKAAQEKRSSIVIKQKFDVKKEIVYKRSNSFDIKLDEFGDYTDRLRIEKRDNALRQSFKIDRQQTVQHKKDIALMAVAEGDGNEDDEKKRPEKERQRKAKKEKAAADDSSSE